MTCQNGIHIPHTFYLSQFDLTYSSRRCNQSSCLQLHQCRCIKCSNQCRYTRQHNKSMVKIKPPKTQPGDWKLKVTSSNMDGQIIRACALNDNTIERKDVQITPNFKSGDRSESTYNHELLCQYSPTFANTTKEFLKLSCTPQDCFKADIKQVGSSPVFDSNIHRHNVDSLLSSFSSLWKPGARFGKSSSEGEHSSSWKQEGRFRTGSSSCEGEHSPLPKQDRRFETRSGSYEGEHSPLPKRDRRFETRSGSGEEEHSPFLKQSIPFQKSTSNFDAEISKFSKPGFTLDNLINTPIHPNSNSSPIKSHFLKLANQNIPGDEPVCYHKVRDECRKYLEQMLTTPDRRMVEAVYFDALERLNKFSSALLKGKCKDSKHDANFRFLTNGAIDHKETSIGLLNFNDKFLQSNNEAMKESWSLQHNLDREKMKRYLEMLKHLKNKVKELEKIRQGLRHEFSYESKSMSKRHNLNHRYFQTLDELNQTKIQMKNLKKYLEGNITNLPTGQISKNYTNEVSDQKMAPKHRPLDLSFSVMDIARDDKQTKRNGSVVCHPSFHLSEPSSFTNITSLDDHVCLSTTHSLVEKERKKEERPSIFRKERGKQLLMVNFPVERQRKEEELSEDNDTDSFKRNEELCNKDMQDTEDKDSINKFESGDEFIKSQDIVNFSEVESSPHLKSDFENSEHLESKDDAIKEGKSTLRPHRIAKGEESRGCARPIKEERSYCEQVFTKRTSLNEKTNIQENHHRENNYLKKENTNKKCDKNYRNVTDKFSFRINKVKRVTNIKSEFLENANYPLECRVNNKTVEKNNSDIEKSIRQNKIKTYKEFCADEVNKINDTDSFENNEELCNEDMQNTEDKDSMKELNIGDRHIQSQDIVNFWECESCPYSNSDLENSEHLELKYDATKEGKSTLRSYEIAEGVESQGCARPIKEEVSYCEQVVTERTFFNGKANIQKNHHGENNYLKKENTNDKYERNNKNDTDKVSLDINKGGQGTNNESEFPENAIHPLKRRVNNKAVDNNNNNIKKSSRQNKIQTYKELCADEVNGSDNDFVDSDVTLEKETASRICNSFYSVPERRLDLFNNTDLVKDVKEEEEGEHDLTEAEIRGGKTSNTRTDVLKQTVRNRCEEQSPRKKDISHKQQIPETDPTEYYHKLVHQKEIPSSSDSHHVPTRTTSSNSDISSPVGKLRHTYDNDSMKKIVPAIEVYELLHLHEYKANPRVDTKADCTGSDDSDNEYTQDVKSNRGIYFRDNSNKLKDNYQVYGSQSFTKAPVTETYNQMFLQNNEGMPSSVLNMESLSTNGIKKLNNIVIKSDEEYFNEGIDVVDSKEKVCHEQKQMNQCEYEDKRAISFDPNDDVSDASTRSYSEAFKDFDSSERFSEEDDFTSDKYRPEKSYVLPLNHTHKNNSSDEKNESEPIRKEIRAQNDVGVDRESEGGHVFSINEEMKDKDDAIPISQGGQTDGHYKRHFTTRNAQNNLPSCESDRFFTIHNSKCITSPHLLTNSTDVKKIKSNIATQTSSHRKSYKDKGVNVATEELFQPIPSTSIRHSIETNGESRIYKTEAEGYKNKLLCEKDVLSTSESKEKGKCLPIKQDTATQTTPIAACVKMSDDSDISIGDISSGVDNIKNFNNKAKTERRRNRTKCGSKEVAVQMLQQVSEIDKFESADVLSKHSATMDIFHSNVDSILDTRLSTLTCNLHDLNHSFSSLLRIAQGSSTSEKEGNDYGNVQRQFIAHDEKDNDPFQQQCSSKESHHTYLLLNHYSDEIVQKVISAVFMEAKFSVSLMQDNCMPFNCGDVFTMASDRIGQKVGDDVTKRYTSTKWHRLEKRKKKIFIQKQLTASSLTCDQENSTATATGKNMSIDKKQYSRERKDTKLLSKMHTTNGIKNCYRKERNNITDFQNGDQKCNSDEEYEMAFGFPECKDELKTAILTVKCNEDGDIVNPKGKKRSVGVNDDLSIRQEFDVLFGNSNINVLQTKTSAFPVTKTDNRMEALSFDDDFISEPSYVREQTSAEKIAHTRSSHFYIDLNSTTDSGFETMENFEDYMEQVSCVKEHRKIYPLIQHNKVLKFGAMESCDFTTNEIQYPLVTTGEVVRTAKLMRCISIDNDGRDVSRDNDKRFVKVEKIINVSNEGKRIKGKAKEAKRRSREKAKIKDGIFKEENDERKIFDESKKKKEEVENNNKSIKLRKRKSKKYHIQKPSNEYLSTDSTGANKNKEEIYEGNLNEGDEDKDWIFADDSNTQNNNIDKVNWNNKFATISPIKSCVNMSTTEDVSLVTLSLENGQTNLDEVILPNSVFKADGMCERVDGNGFYDDAYQENGTGDKRTFILYEGNDMHFNVESNSAEMLPFDCKFGKVAQSNTFNGGTDNKIASLIKNANEVTHKTGNDQDYIERPSILGSSPTISDYISYPEQHYLNGASVSDQKSGLPLAINNSGKDTQKALTKTLAEGNQFIEKMSYPLSLRCNNSRQDAIANTSEEKSQENTDASNINNTPLKIMSVQPNASPINSHSKHWKKATPKHKKVSNDHGEGSILKNKNKFKRWDSTEFEGIMRDINITDEEELFPMVQSDDIKPQKSISHNLLFTSLKEKGDMFHHYVDEENGLPNGSDISQVNTTLDGKMHELLINAQGNSLDDIERNSGKYVNTIYMKSNASSLDDKCINSNKDINLTDEFPPNSTNQVSESENQITASFPDLNFMDKSGGGSNDTSKARPNLISKEVLILSKMSLKNTAEDYLNCYPEENRFGYMKSTYPHMNYSKHVKVSDDYDATIIIDNGSGGIKAGLSTEDLPSITPSIIGTPNYQKVFPTEVDQDCWLGWEANRLRGILKLKYPIEYGIVEDWEGMEKLWNHVFDSVLRVDPSEYPVFLTEPPCNSKKNREKMLEIMMETYDVPAYYVGIQAVMSLYSAGRMTGVVLDSGDSVTNAVPVYEGYGLPHAVKKINIGGRNMTDHLRMILSEKGIPFITSAEFEICREIKETECFIATSPEMFDAVSFPSFAKAYELPDGNVITLDSERIRCPEILFRPALIGEDLPGAHELVYQSIINTDIDLRTELFRNIVLSGGATLFPGIEERLKNELIICSTVNKKNLIKIHSTKERKFSVWKGASILSSLSTFQDMLITNEDYFEVGKSIVHIKCF